MLAQKIQLCNSELKAKLDSETLIIEPNDRAQGFGVAIELAEAIQLAKMILELEAHLRAEETEESYDEFLGRQLDAVDEDAYYGRL